MFDIGFWELLAVLTLGLLVLGPERLSQVVRTAGRWFGRARSMARNMQYELEREVSLSEFDQKNTIVPPPKPAASPAAQPGPDAQKAAQQVDEKAPDEPPSDER